MVSSIAGLRASINEWAERDYDDAQLDEFIGLAEASIRRRLAGYQREITTTVTADADGKASLPADFLGIRSLSYDSRPVRYGISGSALVIVDGAGKTFDLIYFGRLPALSDSNPTNWLLDAAPDVYLFMCQAQQRAFTEEYQTAAGLEAKALGALADLNLQSTVAQYGRAGIRLGIAP